MLGTVGTRPFFFAIVLWMMQVAASIESAKGYFASNGMSKCPIQCEDAGYDASHWTKYHDMASVLACNTSPKFLDFNLRNRLNDPDSPSIIRACSTSRGSLVWETQFSALEAIESDPELVETNVHLQLVFSSSKNLVIFNQKITAIKEIQAALLLKEANPTTNGTSLIVHCGDTIIGVYVGPGIDTRGVAILPLMQFLSYSQDSEVDLDWEYPGAPDIPGIPAADPVDWAGYLELLKLLLAKLPDKSLSIPAPGSFWYLTAFPIAEIAKVVDYIIYMTYDLHGQWDFGNRWSSPGCPSGNCLRSHINMTETINSLAMVTKAGVPSNILIIGMSSYGRSFKMSEPGCTSEMCTFTGPQSGATPGRCTGTPGYVSNAEIKEIISSNPNARTWYETQTMTNYLVYGSDRVSYMDDTNKATRAAAMKALNFGGTTDWAIDLQSFVPPSTDVEETHPITSKPIEYRQDWAKLTCSSPCAKNESISESTRWNELKCDDAWKYGIGLWKKRNPSDTSLLFVQFISNELEGRPDTQCHINAGENGCGGTVECDDDKKVAPGVALILRSFKKLSGLYVNFYDGLVAAHGVMTTGLGEFPEAFAPTQKANDSLTWLFAFLGTGLGMAGGPLFEKGNKFFTRHTDTAGTLQETVMAGVNFGLDKAKDAVRTRSLMESQTDKLAEALLLLSFNWKVLVAQTQAWMFNGSDHSIEYLKSIINQGKMIRTEAESALSIESRVVRALYAYLIPYAWSLRGYNPVLIQAGGDCSKVGLGDYSIILPKDKENSSICIGNVGRLYLLHPVGVARQCRDSTNRGSWSCENYTMKPLPGFSKLGSTNLTRYMKFGELTREDIVNSILNRFSKTGNKTLSKVIDALDDGQRETFKNNLWEQMNGGDIASTAGVNNIPMCTADVAWANWNRATNGEKGNSDWPAFPCNNEE
ncbi:hypothetical protein IFR05_002521 [Cadophora sp. M221]|nr:hypothetical protein IFR05_002521 [Cadophora sp. M221]